MGRRLNSGAGVGGRRPESATDVALKLPTPPQRPIADTPVLIGEEQEVFARCEAAIETLKWAFWAAGKALQIVRDGRLYRGTHKTFDAYLEDRWDMSRGQADKLIRTWPVAESLFDSQSNGLTPIGVKKLNQATVLELVPVADLHGVEAAGVVYRTALAVDGVPVTAEVIKAAVKALPKGEKFDVKAATAAARKAVEKFAAVARPAIPKRRSARSAVNPAAGPASLSDALPWGSPKALDQLLREHMAVEDRLMLAKLLAVG
ncbi:hypothetical protein [Streptomyces sp. RKAG293]|uniref:hypothetical protein n=1 Tax=Streptomyces sp. RKAG293 TaxID=2893403 RepID=UPI0020331E94|nr:hypothetical protein [Streptomyces sp. RKAG293]MCM2424292.1 hypothetical protein [Streptomyces sp. RKAG293]